MMTAVGKQPRARRPLLAVVALAGFHFACAPEGATAAAGDADVGAVALAVRLSDDTAVARVDFQISGNGIAVISGAINVISSAATATALVGGIAPGAGYRIDMATSSTDGRTNCAGQGTFDVRVGEKASVTVLLQCRALAITGGVTVGGTFRACGNSVIDPGEQCDPPVAGMCDGTCQRVGVCGNGVTDPNEQCDPPNGTTCDSSCRSLLAPAANGAAAPGTGAPG